MDSAPFDIELIIARLKAKVPELQTIEGVAEYATMTKITDFRPNSAFVILVAEQADGEEPSRPTAMQRANVSFAVIIAARNYRDQRGGESIADISPLLGDVRKAIKGFIPDVAGARACAWVSGNVLDYDNSVLLWSDVFKTQHFI